MSFHPSKSLRLAAAALVVFVLAALALALPRVADAAPKCTGTSQVWKVNGRNVCLKTARAKPGHESVETSARIARWFAGATKPYKRSKVKLPNKLRAAVPKASAAAVKLVARADAMGKKSRQAPKGRFATAAVGSGGAVIDSVSVDGPSVTLPSGVKLSSRINAREFADGSKKFDVTVDSEYNGYTVRYQPVISEKEGTIPAVTCPTGAGLLTIDYGSTYGGTMMVLKGKGVLAAVTEKFSDKLHATGHVGRDAKLHNVEVEVSSKYEHYERGLQVIVQTAGNFDAPREGVPSSTGPISANVKIRSAGASSAVEKAAEKIVAADTAKSSGSINALAAQADVARWRMLQDEYKWYTLPGYCADINFNPEPTATLGAGQSADVTGKVTGKDGGEASADYTVTSVERGSFAATKAQSDPGSSAHFGAKGASPDADKITVGSEVVATSTAGRAQATWHARDELNLPGALTGTIAVTSEVPGMTNSFAAWAEYTLTNTYVSEGGYISAWYELTSVEQDELEAEIGVGCRWVAKGSGSTIEAGDIELRKPPGGEWQHAVMFDTAIPNTTYVPTDCGPDPPPPLVMDLTAFVNMAMLGGGFEPVGANFHMEAARSYNDEASQRTTTGSWTFDPK